MSFTASDRVRIDDASSAMAKQFLVYDDRQMLAMTGCSLRRSEGEERRRARHAYQASQHYLRAMHNGLLRNDMTAEQAEQAIQTSIGPVAWWLLSALFRALLSQLIQWAIFRPATISALFVKESDPCSNSG